jgi:hypothetical protein
MWCEDGSGYISALGKKIIATREALTGHVSPQSLGASFQSFSQITTILKYTPMCTKSEIIGGQVQFFQFLRLRCRPDLLAIKVLQRCHFWYLKISRSLKFIFCSHYCLTSQALLRAISLTCGIYVTRSGLYIKLEYGSEHILYSCCACFAKLLIQRTRFLGCIFSKFRRGMHPGGLCRLQSEKCNHAVGYQVSILCRLHFLA